MTREMVHELLGGLRARDLRLAVAESCTGGLLGAAITAVPGASTSFVGGVLAYNDRVKTTLLGVPADRIAAQGAVSAAVVEAMAHGVRDRLGADVAVAVSGIAGPDGGSQDKPVGTVWIAVLGPGHLIEAHKFHFDGGRDDIRRDAVRKALELACEAVREAAKEQVA